MKIKEDIILILKELSPILAGFKLALILISWFGLGSVASWVISYWYPFTRRVWDLVCDYLSIPVFSDLVKDSLTALVFFLPIGVSSISCRHSLDGGSLKIRFLGAFFGFFLLFVICRDVFLAIYTSVDFSLSSGFLVDFLGEFEGFFSSSYFIYFSIGYIFLASIFVGILFKMKKINAFLSFFRRYMSLISVGHLEKLP
jgi:hypothetical protein